MTKTTASAVSATLRRAGFSPLGSGGSRMRPGLRAKRSYREGLVMVSVDLDSANAAARMTADAAEVLKAAGYTISGAEATSFYVSREA